MIVGRHDTYLTLPEFATSIGRSEKTVRNWVAAGELTFVHLCGVPLVSIAMLENLISGVVPTSAEGGKLALKLLNRIDRGGRRATPERHKHHDRLEPIATSRLTVDPTSTTNND